MKLTSAGHGGDGTVVACLSASAVELHCAICDIQKYYIQGSF